MTASTRAGQSRLRQLFASIVERCGGRPTCDPDQCECRCPAHDDNRPSLSARLADKNILLHCHRGCSIQAIAQALDLNVGDLSDKPVIVANYIYESAHGEPLYEVVRYFPKDFRVRRPNGNDGYTWSIKGIARVPFRLPELLHAPDDEMVLIVEGEKDVLALVALGFTATTNLGGAKASNGTAGAGKWLFGYNEHFQGRRVVILPDNDPAGRAHAETIAGNLRPLAKSLKVVALPGLPDKGDVSDWLAAGGNKDGLLKLVEAASEWADPHPAELVTVQPLPSYVEPAWPDPPAGEAFHGLLGA
jgi:putative DNA primase/helicase